MTLWDDFWDALGPTVMICIPMIVLWAVGMFYGWRAEQLNRERYDEQEEEEEENVEDIFDFLTTSSEEEDW